MFIALTASSPYSEITNAASSPYSISRSVHSFVGVAFSNAKSAFSPLLEIASIVESTFLTLSAFFIALSASFPCSEITLAAPSYLIIATAQSSVGTLLIALTAVSPDLSIALIADFGELQFFTASTASSPYFANTAAASSPCLAISSAQSLVGTFVSASIALSLDFLSA